jgi:uncharacterized damage-inducible protein DinB
MDDNLKSIYWQQFGAAIDDLGNAVRACPDDIWHDSLYNTGSMPKTVSEFWYIAYHTLFWLDLYLFGSEEGFVPPAPFTLIEQYEDGPLPERPYTKEELQTYLKACRKKCRETIEALTDETAQRRCQFPWGEVSYMELLFYNMRHVQGQASQLNLALGQKTGWAPDWVLRAGEQS